VLDRASFCRAKISRQYAKVSKQMERPALHLAGDEDTPAEFRKENVSLILDEGFQSRQSMLPLIGNAVEIRLELFERLRPELEPALASDAYAAHDTGAFQYTKMFGDRLSR